MPGTLWIELNGPRLVYPPLIRSYFLMPSLPAGAGLRSSYLTHNKCFLFVRLRWFEKITSVATLSRLSQPFPSPPLPPRIHHPFFDPQVPLITPLPPTPLPPHALRFGSRDPLSTCSRSAPPPDSDLNTAIASASVSKTSFTSIPRNVGLNDGTLGSFFPTFVS